MRLNNQLLKDIPKCVEEIRSMELTLENNQLDWNSSKHVGALVRFPTQIE